MVDGLWRIKVNQELVEQYGEPSVTGVVRDQRTKWLRHEAVIKDE